MTKTLDIMERYVRGETDRLRTCLLLRPDDGGKLVVAAAGEGGYLTARLDAPWTQPAVAVSAPALVRAVAANGGGFDGARVDFVDDQVRRFVIGGSSVHALPAEDFPAAPEWPSATPAALVKGADLAGALAAVRLAAARPNNRYGMAFVRMESHGAGARLVATDGNRLHLADVDTVGALATHAHLPVGVVDTLIRCAKLEGRGYVSLAAEARRWRCTGPRWEVVGRTDGEFPDYEDYLHRATDWPCRVGARAFLAAVKTTAPAGPRAQVGHGREVQLAWGEGILTLTGRRPDEGEVAVAVPCEGGGPVPLLFNSAYLIDGVTALGDAEVTLRGTGPGELDMVYCGPATGRRMALLMPMRP